MNFSEQNSIIFARKIVVILYMDDSNRKLRTRKKSRNSHSTMSDEVLVATLKKEKESRPYEFASSTRITEVTSKIFINQTSGRTIESIKKWL